MFAAPQHHYIDPNRLPPPYATASANNGQQVVGQPQGATLRVPPGFKVTLIAAGLRTPRVVKVAPNGDVLVSETGAGRVDLFRQRAGKWQRSTFADGLRQPFGIAFYPLGPNPDRVYIADTNALLSFPYKLGQNHVSGGREILPLTPGGYHQHWTRDVIVSGDGKSLFVSVGSRENVGIEKPPRACVLQCDPNGGHAHVYASGLRNAVGLAVEPQSKKLFACINERDGLGDGVPPDYFTSVKFGGFYGWPYCYIGAHHDPRMPREPALEKRAIVPDVCLTPHCAALQIAFGPGGAWGHDAYVTCHGSWNRRVPVGYDVVRVPMRNGRPAGGFVDFLEGWNLGNGNVWGRPVGVAFIRQGLLVTDDGLGRIWLVSAASASVPK